MLLIHSLSTFSAVCRAHSDAQNPQAHHDITIKVEDAVCMALAAQHLLSAGDRQDEPRISPDCVEKNEHCIRQQKCRSRVHERV
jgi:hypothetical protein